MEARLRSTICGLFCREFHRLDSSLKNFFLQLHPEEMFAKNVVTMHIKLKIVISEHGRFSLNFEARLTNDMSCCREFKVLQPLSETFSLNVEPPRDND